MTITNKTIITLEFGNFEVAHHLTPHGESLSFSYGNVQKGMPIVRLHSACLFGEAFFSLHCDCGTQLRETLGRISKNGSGTIIYGFQEGRGIGIDRKIAAMEIQRTKKIDTVEAFREMGFPPDMRSYDAMIEAIKDLKVCKSIRVISNNPNKINALKNAGFQIKQIIKLRIVLNEHNKNELITKKRKLGHYID